MLNLIKLKENNEINILNQIIDFKNPSYIYIPIINNQTFKKDDYVYKNTCFDKYISSVSGYIKGCKKVLLNNKLIYAVEIENDFKENIKDKNKIKKINNKEELINVLKEYSLDSIVEKLLKIININNLVISSVDEEEYSLKEFLRLSNNYIEILDTIDNLINILNVNNTILAIKNTNFKSIRNVKSIIGTYPNIRITLLPDKYLIGYFLEEYLNLNKEETLVLTTNEIYDIYRVINKGKNINDNLITISGNAIEKSLVINVRLYTNLKEIIDEYIKIIDQDYEMFLNGYLMGTKINNIEEIIITRDVKSIVINKKIKDIETNCINCGACQKICPVNINVKNCYLNKCSNRNCIECGLCNFICPAKIKLKEIVMSDVNEKL